MQTTVPCPSCRRELRVPDSLIGKLVKCPACAQTFTAELSAPAPPAQVEVQPETYRASPSAEDFVDEPAPREQENDYEPRPLPSRRRRRFYVEHRGAMVLTLGILSLVICGFLGPVAWVMGNNDLAAMRAGRMDPAGEGLTQAGRILGIISTALIALVCVFYCGLFMIGALSHGFK
jgi:predicted Zn finger-like uncharacterized protein